MRIHYEERILAIRSQVINMGNLAHDMVRKASESVITGNPSLANDVIRDDDAVDAAERQTTFETIMFVMQESPVGPDLRFLVSTLGVVGEIEEVADDAVKLARRSLKLGTNFPSSMKVQLNDLSEISRRQLASAIRPPRLHTRVSSWATRLGRVANMIPKVLTTRSNAPSR